MEIGKCCKSLLFALENQWLNIYQYTIAPLAHGVGILDLRNIGKLDTKYLIKQVRRVCLKVLCKKKINRISKKLGEER